jgi:hypothetical protein
LWYPFFISAAEEEGSIPLKGEEEVYWSNNYTNRDGLIFMIRGNTQLAGTKDMGKTLYFHKLRFSSCRSYIIM